MNIAEKIKIFLGKLQGLPEDNKKAILWIVVVTLAVIMGFLWLPRAIDNLSKIGGAFSGIEEIKINSPDISVIDNISDILDVNTQLSKETENWKTYNNIEYGFSIKYPLNWGFREYVSGAEFFPLDKSLENEVSIGSFNIGFYSRGLSYCKIPFEDYINIAGPSEIQGYESLNTKKTLLNIGEVKAYQVTWNYKDAQGLGKISLPITYFNIKEEDCGSIEAFLIDNSYLDIYNKVVFTFNFVKK